MWNIEIWDGKVEIESKQTDRFVDVLLHEGGGSVSQAVLVHLRGGVGEDVVEEELLLGESLGVGEGYLAGTTPTHHHTARLVQLHQVQGTDPNRHRQSRRSCGLRCHFG